MAIDCVSNYLRDALNDHLHGGPAFTRPATTYFALFTSSPSSSGGGTEVTGGSYARVAVTNDSTHWPASSGQTKLNASVIDWGTATANWGILLAVGEFDAATAGNLLNLMLLRTSVTLNFREAYTIHSYGVLLDWATATSNWGTSIQICEYDAATGGNLLTMGDLVTPYVINSGTPFQIPVNGAVFNWA